MRGAVSKQRQAFRIIIGRGKQGQATVTRQRAVQIDNRWLAIGEDLAGNGDARKARADRRGHIAGGRAVRDIQYLAIGKRDFQGNISRKLPEFMLQP